jgi:hypothetical protein
MKSALQLRAKPDKIGPRHYIGGLDLVHGKQYVAAEGRPYGWVRRAEQYDCRCAYGGGEMRDS